MDEEKYQRHLEAVKRFYYKNQNHYRWSAINNRCYDSEFKAYKWYGARGIENFWKDDYEGFVEYISQLPHYGESGYSIDRIDNNKNYQPENLKWSTAKEQMNNRRPSSEWVYENARKERAKATSI